jgi:GAF domain-containing protein
VTEPIYDGEMVRAAATRGYPARLDALVREPRRPNRYQRRLLAGERLLHIADLAAINPEQDQDLARILVESVGLRTFVAVPLRKDTTVLGLISAFRLEVRPFSASEITLLESFAAQAVIALENARLFGDLRARTAELAERNAEYGERIEHQSATIDVLKAMSASPGDAQPVFDLIVRRSAHLCNAPTAGLFEYDGKLVHVRAHYDIESVRESALLEAARHVFPMPPTRGSINSRAILDCKIIHIRDVQVESDLLQTVRAFGHRSQVSVPLMRGDTAIGTISLGAWEPGGFSDSQIELLKTFAEQAVIAITSAETYRALQTRTADLQEALEHQTATSDVLKVISRATFDLQPVMDTVVKTAARLCVADMAHIGRRDGETMNFAANCGFPPEYETYLKARGPVKLDPTSPAIGHRTLTEGRPVHIDDVAAVPDYPEVLIRLGKQRTSLGVPLLRDGETIGLIQLSRQRVEPFTTRQIELISTFADQAVIAIENTRLMTEQREALEQQTATADVLQVINANPGNLQPVFDAMLEKAMRLCDAAFGSLYTYDGERFHSAAHRGVPAAYAAFRAMNPPVPAPGSVTAVLLETRKTSHVVDAKARELYQAGSPGARAMVELGGVRSVLDVPLLKENDLIGFISIYRQEVRAFTDKQIALIENFAAQAVIAMENARLLTEQREALEQQTATAEVLQVINSSPGNLTPVFEAILEKAHRLCGATLGSIVTFDGEHFWAEVTHGYRSNTPLGCEGDGG